MRHASARLACGLAALALLGAGACASPPGEPRQPANSDAGLGLRGYDRVAYFERGAATPGDPVLTAHHHGAEHRFASAANRARFEVDPARYLPEYGGYCAIAMAWDRVADAATSRRRTRTGSDAARPSAARPAAGTAPST